MESFTPAAPVAAVNDVAARATRRISWRLMPYLLLLYLIAYIDRTNVGVAKLQMQGDLHLTDAIIGFGAGNGKQQPQTH